VQWQLVSTKRNKTGVWSATGSPSMSSGSLTVTVMVGRRKQWPRQSGLFNGWDLWPVDSPRT